MQNGLTRRCFALASLAGASGLGVGCTSVASLSDGGIAELYSNADATDLAATYSQVSTGSGLCGRSAVARLRW